MGAKVREALGQKRGSRGRAGSGAAGLVATVCANRFLVCANRRQSTTVPAELVYPTGHHALAIDHGLGRGLQLGGLVSERTANLMRTVVHATSEKPCRPYCRMRTVLSAEHATFCWPGRRCSSDARSDEAPRPTVAFGIQPATIGAFNSQSGLWIDAHDGQKTDSSFGGECTGIITQAPSAIGDWARGTFSCRSLGGNGETDPGLKSSVSDGVFNVLVEMAPPE